MRRAVIAVGVDPGATFTGVIARVGDQLQHAAVLDRTKLLDDWIDAELAERRKAWTRVVMLHVADVLDEVVPGPPEHARSAWDVAGAALALSRFVPTSIGGR